MKQILKEKIPVTLNQYGCVLCEKKFYINVDDTHEKAKLVCPFCNATEILDMRQFDVEILSILDKQ